MSESADCPQKQRCPVPDVVPVSGQAAWVPVDKPVYPALWKRWISGGIDAAVLLPVVPAAWWAAWPALPDGDAIVDTGVFLCRLALIMIVAGWIYTVSLQAGPSGSTLGERLMRIRARRMSGRALGWKAATLRYFGGVATLGCLGIPLVSCIASPRLRAWHDALAGAVVVNVPYGHSHIRVYAQRASLRDAAATGLLVLVLTTGWFTLGWPWLSTFDERMRVTRALQSVDETLFELQSRALFDKRFPTLEESISDPRANFGSIPMGPDARATYIGDGRVEVQMLFEPLDGHKVILQAPQVAGEHVQCVYADLPPDNLPVWCRP